MYFCYSGSVPRAQLCLSSKYYHVNWFARCVRGRSRARTRHPKNVFVLRGKIVYNNNCERFRRPAIIYHRIRNIYIYVYIAIYTYNSRDRFELNYTFT